MFSLAGLQAKLIALGGIVLAFLAAALRIRGLKKDVAEEQRRADRAEAQRDQVVDHQEIREEIREDREESNVQDDKDKAAGRVPHSLGGGINDWD